MEFAQSGPAALQRINDGSDVSLILIMPGMSGLELLPKAKALRPDVPVVMITAYCDAETKRKALENGAEAPIDFVTLTAARSTCGLNALFDRSLLRRWGYPTRQLSPVIPADRLHGSRREPFSRS
jgi:CheY-like chemotaxis protein